MKVRCEWIFKVVEAARPAFLEEKIGEAIKTDAG